MVQVSSKSHQIPVFTSPPRPHYNDGPLLQEYKQRILNSLKKRAYERSQEIAEQDLVNLNRERKAVNASPAQGIRYVWKDEGLPSPRQPTSEMICAQAIDNSGSGKKKKWNPQKERYMEFTCTRGITRYEDSDLNMSPEGKMRRQLMNQHDSEPIIIKAAQSDRGHPNHYWDKSMQTKINDAEARQSSYLLVNLGKTRQSRY